MTSKWNWSVVRGQWSVAADSARHRLLTTHYGLLTALCFLLSAFCISAASLSITNIRVPIVGIGEPAPTSMVKIASSLVILSNNAAAGGTGGSGFYIATTNGFGTNLGVAQPFTLYESALTFINWTNPPIVTSPPTNLPPSTDFTNSVGCTNISGPYYPTTTPNIFTNACGFVMIITTGGDPDTDPGSYETNYIPVMTNQVDAFSRNLYQITVTDSAFGLAGTYIWTNGAFMLNGIPTNCTTRTLAFDSGGDRWIFHKTDGTTLSSINGGVGGKLNTSLNWGGDVAISTNSHNTNIGFPRFYWPGFDMSVSGIVGGPVNLNGVYRFHHRVNTAFGFTNEAGAYMNIGGAFRVFNNSWVRWTNLSTCSLYSDSYWHNQYDIMEFGIYGDGITFSASRENFLTNSSPTSTVKVWTFGSGVSGTPSAYPINRPHQWTNQIVICPPPSPGDPPAGEPGIGQNRLIYHNGQVDCTYLRTYPQYCSLANALNQLFCQADGTGCCHMWLDNDGTFYMTGPGVSLSVPQSNTSEWRPCP